jgi:hypothetical protein
MGLDFQRRLRRSDMLTALVNNHGEGYPVITFHATRPTPMAVSNPTEFRLTGSS